MTDGRQVEAALHALNPYTHNKFLWMLFKPTEQTVQSYIDILNAYLRERYAEENLTVFTYAALLKLFSWEERIKQEVERITVCALPFIKDGDVVFDIGANMGRSPCTCPNSVRLH